MYFKLIINVPCHFKAVLYLFLFDFCSRSAEEDSAPGTPGGGSGPQQAAPRRKKRLSASQSSSLETAEAAPVSGEFTK